MKKKHGSKQITRSSVKRSAGRPVRAVVANASGEIFDLEDYAAVGMAGATFVMLTTDDCVTMPSGGELMYLPERRPVVFNLEKNCFETLSVDPYNPDEPIFPVAAFNSPGYVNLYVSAYEETKGADCLPLFSFGAAGWHRGKLQVPVMQIDHEPRQDLRQMPHQKIVAGVRQLKKKMPSNRLRRHLEKCALTYGCPAAKNFFIGRYEAPLPTSQACNANCIGCISLQKDSGISCSQDRINFTPTPEEITEVALEHIMRVEKSVVSFGQGCEGDPLMAAHVIKPAISRIRSATRRGTINVNTNASRPDVIEELIHAGLDSIRVSMNSVRRACYDAYFRPKGYVFDGVLESIAVALQKGVFVSINYFNCPGVTDTDEEIGALNSFLLSYPVNMIQWRNLNFDPARYWKTMSSAADQRQPAGMRQLINRLKSDFPNLRHGYFNPPKETFPKTNI